MAFIIKDKRRRRKEKEGVRRLLSSGPVSNVVRHEQRLGSGLRNTKERKEKEGVRRGAMPEFHFSPSFSWSLSREMKCLWAKIRVAYFWQGKKKREQKEEVFEKRPIGLLLLLLPLACRGPEISLNYWRERRRKRENSADRQTSFSPSSYSSSHFPCFLSDHGQERL